MKQEKVGLVTLDYTLYSGEDLYSDGQIEDELLNIVQNYEEEQFENIIKEKKDWAILYHLSQVRQNIVNWFPITKDQKVLEIGAGCGAITGALANRAGQVDCVELSKKRSLINANRNKKYDNITIKVGNFEKIEPLLDKDYDVITLIGVWEYSALYLDAENPFEKFLNLLKKHIKKGGKVIIAIENKFGLKYWAGCKEDHTGLFFEGLEGYTKTKGAITFGKNALEKMFSDAAYCAQFYYPYPDYKLPLRIYSDDYLPKRGELNLNGCNLDTDRLVLFNDDKVFDQIVEEGMFPFFSNSFLIVLENKEAKEHISKINDKHELSEKEVCKKTEQNFQEYLVGFGENIEDLSIIKAKHDVKKMLFVKKAVKIYKDYGQGFSEENVEIYNYSSPQNICLEIEKSEEIKALRIDPMENRGIVHLKTIEIDTEKERYIPEFTVNGEEIDKGYYLFNTTDPWFLIEQFRGDTLKLYVYFDLTELSEDIVSLYQKQNIDTETKTIKKANLGKRISTLFQ